MSALASDAHRRITAHARFRGPASARSNAASASVRASTLLASTSSNTPSASQKAAPLPTASDAKIHRSNQSWRNRGDSSRTIVSGSTTTFSALLNAGRPAPPSGRAEPTHAAASSITFMRGLDRSRPSSGSAGIVTPGRVGRLGRSTGTSGRVRTASTTSPKCSSASNTSRVVRLSALLLPDELGTGKY